jgi:intracellular multiplication protein IcmD
MSKQGRQRIFSAIFVRLVAIFLGVFFAADALATGTQLSLTSLNTSLGSGIGKVVTMMQDIATVSGVGFIFFKFHQHKQNPQQIKLSDGVAMLVIGAGLTIFPHLLGTVSKGVFGESLSKVGGSDISQAIGS